MQQSVPSRTENRSKPEFLVSGTASSTFFPKYHIGMSVAPAAEPALFYNFSQSHHSVLRAVLLVVAAAADEDHPS